MGTPGHDVRRLVRAARERKDWSQIDLAKVAKVSRGTVQNLENGMALQEGKESRIERALELQVGAIDDVRNGRVSIERALGASAAAGEAPPAQRPLASLAAELEYFRILLGAEDFHRMMALVDALYQERRRRETSRDNNAEGDRLEDAG